MSFEKYGWAIQISLFAQTNQDSTFSHTRENSKMVNITSKYFSFFKNKPPAIPCNSCSYYSSIAELINYQQIHEIRIPIYNDEVLEKFFMNGKKNAFYYLQRKSISELLLSVITKNSHYKKMSTQ